MFYEVFIVYSTQIKMFGIRQKKIDFLGDRQNVCIFGVVT